MTFRLKIACDNEAFADAGEVARILRAVADKVERGENEVLCRDSNGNLVGEARFTGRAVRHA